MKKVSSRPEFGSSSSFTADLFDEDASSLGSLINRPEAVGSTDLAQNSNFFQKLQLAQNSLRSQDLDGGSGGNLRDFESFSPSAASTNVDSRLSRPEERFLPLVSGPAAVVKTRTGGGGAVFPQDSDIITADSTSGVGSSLSSGGGAASSGGFSQDFDFEEYFIKWNGHLVFNIKHRESDFNYYLTMDFSANRLLIKKAFYII